MPIYPSPKHVGDCERDCHASECPCQDQAGDVAAASECACGREHSEPWPDDTVHPVGCQCADCRFWCDGNQRDRGIVF